MEPNGVYLRLWMRFNYPSAYEPDASGFANVATLVGSPVFVEGMPGFDSHEIQRSK
jgi:hypothetical protein